MSRNNETCVINDSIFEISYKRQPITLQKTSAAQRTRSEKESAVSRRHVINVKTTMNIQRKKKETNVFRQGNDINAENDNIVK